MMYNALFSLTHPQRALLSILRPKRIEPAQLIYDDNHETIYGEYGFVRKATLDQVRVVAVKTFPPAGGRDDKAHLVLVSIQAYFSRSKARLYTETCT